MNPIVRTIISSCIALMLFAFAAADVANGQGVNKSLKKASDLFQRSEFAKAEVVLRQILKRDPGNNAANTLLGRIYLRESKTTKAAKFFIQGGIPFDDPDAAFDFGSSMFSLKRYEDAIEAFRIAKSKPEYNDLSEFYAGVSYLRIKNYGRAASNLRRARILPREQARYKRQVLRSLRNQRSGGYRPAARSYQSFPDYPSYSPNTPKGGAVNYNTAPLNPESANANKGDDESDNKPKRGWNFDGEPYLGYQQAGAKAEKHGAGFDEYEKSGAIAGFTANLFNQEGRGSLFNQFGVYAEANWSDLQWNGREVQFKKSGATAYSSTANLDKTSVEVNANDFSETPLLRPSDMDRSWDIGALPSVTLAFSDSFSLQLAGGFSYFDNPDSSSAGTRFVLRPTANFEKNDLDIAVVFESENAERSGLKNGTNEKMCGRGDISVESTSFNTLVYGEYTSQLYRLGPELNDRMGQVCNDIGIFESALRFGLGIEKPQNDTLLKLTAEYASYTPFLVNGAELIVNGPYDLYSAGANYSLDFPFGITLTGVVAYDYSSTYKRNNIRDLSKETEANTSTETTTNTSETSPSSPTGINAVASRSRLTYGLRSEVSPAKWLSAQFEILNRSDTFTPEGKQDAVNMFKQNVPDQTLEYRVQLQVSLAF
jgi:Tfp pilus assembly protein PilF